MIYKKYFFEEWEIHPSGLHVSTLGRVYVPPNVGKERITIGHKCGKRGGYLGVTIKGHLYLVHRLVGECFIPNPNNLPQINHKDENGFNNCVDNLEWCDALYNNNYGTRKARIAKKFARPVKQYSLEGEFIKEYPSAKEASRQLRTSSGRICECANGKIPNCRGSVWVWADKVA